MDDILNHWMCFSPERGGFLDVLDLIQGTQVEPTNPIIWSNMALVYAYGQAGGKVSRFDACDFEVLNSWHCLTALRGS